MDDEDGRCLLDVICDPEALNDFLHGSETHLDTDDLLDGSSDPSSSFFSSAGGLVPEVQPPAQLSVSEPPGLPRVSVDLDFLEDDDILGGSPGGGGESGSNGIGSNHEPCDILQQSLAEANITEQSLQEAEAELDLGAFGIPGLTQVVQTLPDASLSGAGATAVGVGIGAAAIFPGSGPSSSATPPTATADMLGSVLAQQGLHLQPQVMNKAISVQPFMQPMGLGNVTLQSISGLQALSNGSQPGHLGIGQIQVVGQPTVMTINQSGQPILAKAMGGYQLHQPGPEATGAGAQAGLAGSVLSNAGGLLIQGVKATLGSPALNGPAVSIGTTTNSGGGGIMTAPAGLLGFGGTQLGAGVAPQTQTQGQIMQNVIIQRTPTPIQPKPPQGGVLQPKLFKQQQQQQQQQTITHTLQNDASKALGVQQVPVSAAQNVTFLTGKPGSNMVLSAQAASQNPQFQQALFKQQAAHQSGKPLSVHLLNQSGSIVMSSLQGQNHQFLLPQLQAGGQILTQHPGGHIITSQGPGGQLIANQILAANQNINLSQVLASQGHPAGTILSGHIQLQPGQMGHPTTLFQMPVTLAQQTQNQSHPVTGHAQQQTVIQGIQPIQNSLAMLSQVEGLSPAAVSLQQALQPQTGGVPSNGTGVALSQGQPGESVTVLDSTMDQAAHPGHPQASILTMQQQPSSIPVAVSVPSSSSCSPSLSVSTASSGVTTLGLAGPQSQHSPHGRVVFTPQGSSMILSQESLQMFLQQEQHQQQTENDSAPSVGVPASVIVSSNSGSGPAPSGQDSQLAELGVGQSPSPSHGPAHMAAVVQKAGHQQPLRIQSMSPSPALTAHRADSPQPSHSPLTLSQQIHSPHPPQQQQQQQPRPPSQPQTPSRSLTPQPPFFIVHNPQIPASSPQPAPQNHPQQLAQQQQPAHIQVQLQPQAVAQSQPATFQQDMPPAAAASCSPTPPTASPVQYQFSGAQATTVVKATGPIPVLTAEQQHHLQLVASQLQTLSGISQPSPQQKQLLDKLHQVQQNILLQAKQQAQVQAQTQAQLLLQVQSQPASQFSSQQDGPRAQVVAPAAGVPAQLTPMLQQTSVLVKTPATASNDLQVFSGAQAPGSAMVNQTVNQVSLNQSLQPKAGVISSVGGLSLGKVGVQSQMMGSVLPQPAAPHPAVLTQPQIATIKMPLCAEPSKEARLLEQIRKQQGGALHPNYTTPFHNFEDTLSRLLPYHLYQGTASSPTDYRKVDDEFETVSCQLLKRTQAMLDKYRHLLFEESKRLGPSAEMVMIDRMFIQEEKMALGQDRILAKERPEEFVANARMMESAAASLAQQRTHQSALPCGSGKLGRAAAPVAPPPAVPLPLPKVAPAPVATPAPAPAPVPAPAPTPVHAPPPAPPAHYPPTKLVIKQGGGGASVSWSSSCSPAPAAGLRLVAEPAHRSSSSRGQSSLSCSSSSYSSSSGRRAAAAVFDDEDDDAMPQRTSKPPMKTYEARRRIGLKLKIKQEAGFSKVVHNTALDPVHHTPQPQPQQHSTPPLPKAQPPPPESQPAQSHPKALPVTQPPSRIVRTPPPTCGTLSLATVTIATPQSNPAHRVTSLSGTAPPLSSCSSSSSTSTTTTSSSQPWSSSSSVTPSSTSSASTTQMNGTQEHHDAGGLKRNPASTATPPQTTCRLPLRKTYRENISPRVRPGVPGGGDDTLPYPRPTPSPPKDRVSAPSSPASEQTVIASVKLEKRGRDSEPGQDGSRLGNAVQGLDQVEEAFYRGIKNTQRLHGTHLPGTEEQQQEEEGEEEGKDEEHPDQETDVSHYRRTGAKSRQRAGGTFERMDQHAPGPPSPDFPCARDSSSSLPAKRCKSDSPDMDNASFSSGSPPDESLNEHLQCAIDSILNLQQGPSSRSSKGRPGRPRHHHHHHHHHPHQRPGAPGGPPAAPSHRPSVPPPSSSSSSSSSSSLAQHPQVAGRGHNGSLVPQTHGR